ncbi:MAG: methyl-accepting chemotaxis protein [Eubacterium sp.]|nr:methyl-accepting chemotaxis protein [Eubacterium sp.]
MKFKKSEENSVKTNRRNRKMVGRVINISLICVVAIAVVLTIIGSVLIDRAYEDMTEEELKATAEQMADLYNYAYEGDWAMSDDGTLTKGSTVMSGDYELIDDLKTKTGVDYTLFYMDTRVLTTIVNAEGERDVNTTASEEVVSAVVEGLEEYYARGIEVEGTSYDIYYIPMLNSDGSCQGMVSTARPVADVTAAIKRAISFMVLVALIGVIVIFVIGRMIASKISVIMNQVAGELKELAEGDLTMTMDETVIDRNDELGSIAESVSHINEKLVNVIKTSQKISGDLHKAGADLSASADTSSVVSDQVSDAVSEIAKGAVSQAESMQTAAEDTSLIGDDIDSITESVNLLDENAVEMKQSCRAAMSALESLIGQSKEVQDSVDEIGKTISSTSDSAKAISEFTEEIAAIASETNLLSLNASIEAARAGEAGRGFAVVATEIGQLAVQSNESAAKIKEIVGHLVDDVEESVEVMERLNESFEVQFKHLDSTKNDMESMVHNVENVTDSTANINGKIGELNESKRNLVDVISDLSAISEENAAATEETNASMEELNAEFAIIAESSAMLQELAEDMLNTISYFHD